MLYDDSDYIHDNCEDGRNERYFFHCHVMLAANTFASLTSTCDEMGGQLTWFDTTQENDHLMGRVRSYRTADLQGHLYTGKVSPGTCTVHIRRTC